ncbi:hypothetical protein EVAR_82970_1 [Eumeta japonica]|uniref:Uncharacterized protein n=1 Tax=Eumeta variegata TaxID=151549 RepID=A0A4C1VR57_EUMVA|nr:hypothetical protein EVAR_82970_1 [Eumeta japonica]
MQEIILGKKGCGAEPRLFPGCYAVGSGKQTRRAQESLCAPIAVIVVGSPINAPLATRGLVHDRRTSANYGPRR